MIDSASIARAVAALLAVSAASAQSGLSLPAAATVSPAPNGFSSIVRTVARDQAAIAASPARIRTRDWKWLLPLAGSAGWLLASDSRNMRERIKVNPAARDRSLFVSNAGVVSLAAVPALLYWSGWRNSDTYRSRTGILSARAVAGALVVTGVLRAATARENPREGDGSGSFFAARKLSSSFPSAHSGAAWAIASVVASRHSGWLTRAGAYGLAGAVSLSRVGAREHFPSDVFIGSALGFLIGRLVSGSSHDSRESRTAWAPPAPAAPALPAAFETSAGDTYVPLDSWIYGALDRLAAAGLIPSQISGLRPWTREECRRQALEAEANLSRSGRSDAAALVRELLSEFETTAGPAVVLHSVYTRNGFIAGPALNDSFHFGQTWTGDSGRPFGRGWNSYTGFTASAQSGRFFAFLNGEIQRAPGREPLSLPVRQTISAMDGKPLQPAVPGSDIGRFRALDAYAGFRLGAFAISVGKQSLWWGPTYDAPLSFSNNAEPTKNLKISTVHPFRIWPVREIRGEFVLGKLGGHSYTWRPWFNAQKLSFKLTENLEMGFTRWSIFWGVGHPITPRSFIRNFTSTNSPLDGSGVGRTDPGDRKAGFDFRYRVPGLRNWLTLYSDSYADDDPSPLANPRRAALNPGLYLARVPGLPRLDIRVEAPSTTPPDGAWDYRGLNYINNQYLSGNTNYGNMLGSWVGPDGRALEAWAGYSLSPRHKAELGFRRLKTSAKYLPGGATQSDATARTSFDLGRDWRASLFLQYEKFYVPLLGPRRSNLSGWMQIAWEPNLQILEKRNYQK